MKFESDREIGVVSAVMWTLCNKLTQQRQTEPAAKLSLIDQPSALLSLVVRKGLVSTCSSNLFHSHGVLCVVNRIFASSCPKFCLSLRFLLNPRRASLKRCGTCASQSQQPSETNFRSLAHKVT